MARRHHVEGTREFLYWGIGLALFSLWFVKDGWFPTEAILAKHPPGTDSYYFFNKTMAGFMILASIVCFYVHKVVK